MTESELIDVVNEWAAEDPAFRYQLQQSVANKNLSQIRKLIDRVTEQIDQSINSETIDRVIEWFFE